MKTTLLSLAMSLLVALTINAQDKPAPSPANMTKQTVGLTDITVEYSRPSAKDRKVFGELVPYGKPWRAGANAATKITLSTSANIGGAELEAGEYAMLITPEKDEWTLHFWPYESGRYSTYLESGTDAILGKTADVKKAGDFQETWLITFDELRDNSAHMHLIWENTKAVVPVTVP